MHFSVPQNTYFSVLRLCIAQYESCERERYRVKTYNTVRYKNTRNDLFGVSRCPQVRAVVAFSDVYNMYQ